MRYYANNIQKNHPFRGVKWVIDFGKIFWYNISIGKCVVREGREFYSEK